MFPFVKTSILVLVCILISIASSEIVDFPFDEITEISTAGDSACELYYLFVKVLCAGNLIAADVKGSSDPFVRVSVGENTVETEVIRNNLYPHWDETLILPVSSLDEKIVFKVYDKDTFTSSDFLGSVQTSIPPAGDEQLKLFRLYGGEYGSNFAAALNTHGKAAKSKVITSIAVQTATAAAGGNTVAGNLMGKFMNTVQTMGTEDKVNAEEQANILLGASNSKEEYLGQVEFNWGVLTVILGLLPSNEAASSFSVQVPPNVGGCTIRLIGARNLIAADLSSSPSSDPYCVLSMNGEEMKANVVKNSVNPDWKQTFAFKAPGVLSLQIFDKDRLGSDDDLGKTSVDISGVSPGVETYFLLRLEGGSGGENMQALINDTLKPVSGDIASSIAQQAFGGPAGAFTDAAMEFIAGKDDENLNFGVIAISIFISE